MHELRIAIGLRIKALRKLRGLSKEKFAELLGVSEQQVKNYETGATDIKLSRLVQMADVLGVTVHDIVCAEPADQPGDRTIVNAWHALKSDKARELLLLMARKLKAF